jgi:hypothetical protein
MSPQKVLRKKTWIRLTASFQALLRIQNLKNSSHNRKIQYIPFNNKNTRNCINMLISLARSLLVSSMERESTSLPGTASFSSRRQTIC